MGDVTASKQLDCRNMSCPMPVIQADAEIKNMRHGQVLEILGTDPAAKKELQEYAEKQGHHFLGFEDTPEFTRYLIRIT
jgi:tRNA 2-thiouridine synthesizing protein A